MSRYFWPILTPSPCHTLSRIPEPPKYVTHLGPPTFFIRPSTKNSDKNLLNKKLGQKPSVQILSQLFVGFFRGSLVWKVLFGGFVRSPSVRIQQKVKHHLKFQVSYV